MRVTFALGLLATTALAQSTAIQYLADAATNCPIVANEMCPTGATDCDAATIESYCNECYSNVRYLCKYWGTAQSWGKCVKQVTEMAVESQSCPTEW